MNISSRLLAECDFLTADIVFERRSGKPETATILVFRFDNHAYAYLNRCMHMQKPLNCMQDSIFDRNRRHLRCSMHGFVFEPESGLCLSPVCEGQSLEKIKLVEQDGSIRLRDKHAKIVKVYRQGKEPV